LAPRESLVGKKAMPETRFHSRVLNMLGLLPDVSAANEVHARELACGFRFPPSVVEWYSRGDAVEIMEAHRNGNADSGGYIVPLALLGEPGANDPDVPFRGYLQIYHAGEADFPMYLILDGSDDPAVFVDDSYFDEEELLVPKLVRWKDSFSEFISDWVARGRRLSR
jgi:hypothetical protein